MPTSTPVPTITDQWALVAAPVSLLPQIYRQIEQHLGLATLPAASPAAATEQSSAPAPGTTGAEAASGWTDEDLGRLAAAAEKFKAIGIVADVADICATEPDRWFPTSELLERLAPKGVEIGPLRMAWTHLTRHLKTHHHRSDWPLEAEWGPRITRDFPQEVHYALSHQRAAQWKRLRGLRT